MGVGILVLSARPELAANQRLAAAAESCGLSLRVVDATRVVARIGGGSGLQLDSEILLEEQPRAVMARVGNWRPESLLALLEVAEQRGTWTPNPAAAMRVGRDHWQTLQRLSEVGLPVPDSIVGADPECLATEAHELGFPLVVKQRRSRMGVGVIRCTAQDQLECVLDAMWRVGDELLVQRWIETGNASLRLLVVGDSVIAAARFIAATTDWRSNGARGGHAIGHHPSSHECELALQAASTVGLGVCGVDLLPSPGGPVICEVNPTPGFVHLEEASGTDIASAIVRYLACCGVNA